MGGRLPLEMRDSVRQVSKTLLGNRLRLEVGAAIAQSEDGLVYGREVARQLEVADNQALSELRHFTAAGLVDELPTVADQKRRYFQRKHGENSEFWDRWLDLLQEIVEILLNDTTMTPDPADPPGTKPTWASPPPPNRK
jgi:hypothetical protein